MAVARATFWRSEPERLPTHPDRRRTPQDSGGHCAACFGLHPARDSAGQAGLFTRTTVDSDELPLGAEATGRCKYSRPRSRRRPARAACSAALENGGLPPRRLTPLDSGGDGRVPRLAVRPCPAGSGSAPHGCARVAVGPACPSGRKLPSGRPSYGRGIFPLAPF